MIVGTTSAQSPGLSEGMEHTSMVLMANEHAAGERSYRVARAATGPGEVIPFRRGGWRNGPLARPKRASVVSLWGVLSTNGGNQTKFNTTLKETLNSIDAKPPYQQRPSALRRTRSKQRLARDISLPQTRGQLCKMTPTCTISLLLAPQYSRGWRPIRGEGRMCTSSFLCFQNPKACAVGKGQDEL